MGHPVTPPLAIEIDKTPRRLTGRGFAIFFSTKMDD